MNKPEMRARVFVSFGGIGSANSLGKFYAMLANNGRTQDRSASASQRRDKQFFSTKTIGWMTTTLTDGIDRVFQIPTAFSAGFMKDSRQSSRHVFGPSRELGQMLRLGPFGQHGAGGSHAFADPENKISFAYVMNQMEQSVLPNEKSLRLVDALCHCL